MEDLVLYFAKKGIRCYAGVRKREDYDKWLKFSNVVPVILDVTDHESIMKAQKVVESDLKAQNKVS